MNYVYATYDTPLCPIVATPPDAPSANVKWQIAQGHSKELKFSLPESQVFKKPLFFRLPKCNFQNRSSL